MPELPEVETVRRGLLPVLHRRRITRVILRRNKLRFPIPPNLIECLEGAEVSQLDRRGKFLLLGLNNGYSLIIHLGMSGSIRIDDSGDQTEADTPPAQRHDHAIFITDDDHAVIYNDPRRFGFLDLMETSARAEHPMLKMLGPEPLGNQFNATYLNQQLITRSGPIKSALLNQRLVAGLGNIYVCEALFRARLHPLRPANSIADRRVDVQPPALLGLIQAIRDILHPAIAAGGSSLRDHRQPHGELGYFQHNFAVYGRDNAPCHRDGCAGIIANIRIAGRSSYYCPHCQPHDGNGL